MAELQGDPGQVKSLSTSLRLVSFFEKKADLLSGWSLLAREASGIEAEVEAGPLKDQD